VAGAGFYGAAPPPSMAIFQPGPGLEEMPLPALVPRAGAIGCPRQRRRFCLWP